MNVAKPGGPAGPSPSDGSPGAGGSSPAGPERKFADVLSGKSGQSNPSQVQNAGQIQNAQKANEPFRAPILDDGPAKVSGPSRINGLNSAQRVHSPVRTLEVRGEKVGRSPAMGGVEQPAGNQQVGWQKMADDTFRSETRIDSLIKSAQGGKSFNASELMALQVEVFRYSQTVEVISRTTDKLVGAIKQTLGTQV